jgi:nucleoid-associated protein YgaU
MADGQVKLEKAQLMLLQPATSGRPPANVGTLVFRFNPKEYTLQKSASWQRSPVRGAAQTAMPEFTGAQPRSLALELFLDASDSDSGNVAKDIELLLSCLTPLPDTVDANTPSPPFVRFSWGSTIAFIGVVRSVSARFTLFRPDGTAVRATCDLQLEELPVQTPRQNPTSGGTGAPRLHVFVAGDSLPSIAYQRYGDPQRWRTVAEANGIDDPARITLGRRIVVPSLPPDRRARRAP